MPSRSSGIANDASLDARLFHLLDDVNPDLQLYLV